MKPSLDRLSATQVARIMTSLISICKLAENWGYVAKSPADGVKKPTNDTPDMDFLDAKEVALMLEAADSPHYALLLTLPATGFRTGEMFGLTWPDIDWAARTIFVKKQAQSGEQVDPKRNSKRRVPMGLKLMDALKAHQTRQIVEGGPNPLELVFPSKAGTQMLGINFARRIWYPTLTRAGLRRVVPHSLRHSYATISLTNGVSLAEVSNSLGHKDVSFTAKRYVHWLPMGTISADKLERAIFEASDIVRSA